MNKFKKVLLSFGLLAATPALSEPTLEISIISPEGGNWENDFNVIFDRLGPKSANINNPSSAFFDFWTESERWFAKNGTLKVSQGQDSTFARVEIPEWPQGEKIPTDGRFEKFRQEISSLSTLFNESNSNEHGWDFLWMDFSTKLQLNKVTLCLSLPHFAMTQGPDFIPPFLKKMAEDTCNSYSDPFIFYPIAFDHCSTGQSSDNPLCEFDLVPAPVTAREIEKIEIFSGNKWIPNWSQLSFEPNSKLVSLKFPFQDICNVSGRAHKEGESKSNLTQFAKSTFLKGADTSIFDLTNAPNAWLNSTDWLAVDLSCSSRFAELVANIIPALAYYLKQPDFRQNPWLRAMLRNQSQNAPSKIVTAKSRADEYEKFLKNDTFTFENGYSLNKLNPWSDLTANGRSEITHGANDTAAILLQMLVPPAGGTVSPWKSEFLKESEENQKGYISSMIKSIARKCPALGSDSFTDWQCISEWTRTFYSNSTAKFTVKRQGKPDEFVRYGIL